MRIILSAIDKTTPLGKRDYILLTFMYNTGGRVSEVVGVRKCDIHIGRKKESYVTLLGKGGKTRDCPLWDTTIELLQDLMTGIGEKENIFKNLRGENLTRFGVYEMIRRTAEVAAKEHPSMKEKQISPHTIRHTTASHLLDANVDINTIRGWLGHVSLNTTNVYAEVSMKRKIEALESCGSIQHQNDQKAEWKNDDEVQEFLKKLRKG